MADRPRQVSFRNATGREISIRGMAVAPGGHISLTDSLTTEALNQGLERITAVLPAAPEEGPISLPTDGKLVAYGGSDRDFLDASVAPARRRGIKVDFLQGVQGRAMRRVIVVDDPSMPELARRQEYQLPSGHSWRDGLVTLGLVKGTLRPPTLEVPFHQIHEWQCGFNHLPAFGTVYLATKNTSDLEYGVLVVLEHRDDGDWLELARKASAVPAGLNEGARLEMHFADKGEFRAGYRLGGNGDLVVKDAWVRLRTADGVDHVFHESGQSTHTPSGTAMPPMS